MRIQTIVPVSLLLMVFMVMSAGCSTTNSEKQPIVTPTPGTTAVQLFNKGFDSYIDGDYPTALNFYNESIASDPTFTLVWIEKGKVLVRLNRSAEAISAYDSALALDNNISEIWNNRGEALMNLGRYTEALDSFEKALQIAPDYTTAKENKDLALAKLK
jgi:tetratricopeptide (TPR) repeat protein